MNLPLPTWLFTPPPPPPYLAVHSSPSLPGCSLFPLPTWLFTLPPPYLAVHSPPPPPTWLSLLPLPTWLSLLPLPTWLDHSAILQANNGLQKPLLKTSWKSTGYSVGVDEVTSSTCLKTQVKYKCMCTATPTCATPTCATPHVPHPHVPHYMCHIHMCHTHMYPPTCTSPHIHT